MASSRKRKHNNNEDANDLTIDGINTISVKTYTGETFSLQVKGSDRIISVKSKITDKLYYLPPDEQALIFNNMVLEDVITLADYRVKKESTLTLMRKSSGLVPIFIIDLDRKRRWPVNVKLSDTIRDLKAQISYLIYPHEYPDATIVFKDIVLDDCCILANFHITVNSVLTLMLKSTVKTMQSKTMEIFVKTLSGKTIALDVIAITTINQVKTAIWCQENIPKDEQVLIFNEMVLDDNSIIFDFGIKKGSTLTLMRVSKGLMQIHVINAVNGKSRSIEVKPSDTIGNLKNQISDKLGILVDEQVLVFNEMVLHDSGTLADFDIKRESTLTVTRKSTGLMHIHVNAVNGKSRSIEVKPSDTIRNLKNQIGDELGIPIDEHVWIFNEMVLHDSGTLADFDIKRESILTLTRKSTGLIQIFVNTVTGMSTSVEVKPSDTVGNLKNQISEKVDIPIDKQVLIFNEMVLDDSGTLADFDIKTESSLTVMRKSRSSMQIIVHNFIGRKIPLEVSPLHTIANLKARVSEKDIIRTKDLRLIFNGQILQDNRTCGDYNIQKDDVIRAVLNKGGWKWGNGLKI